MSIYLITYYMQPQTHQHDSCGCEDHNHEAHAECGCGDEHHEHGENCGCGEDPDYDLVLEIETLGRWAQFMPSSYLVQCDLTSETIIERLEPHVGKRDLLFVSKVDPSDVASLTPQVEDWIERLSKES